MARKEITNGKKILPNITHKIIPIKTKIIPHNNTKKFLFFCPLTIIINILREYKFNYLKRLSYFNIFTTERKI